MRRKSVDWSESACKGLWREREENNERTCKSITLSIHTRSYLLQIPVNLFVSVPRKTSISHQHENQFEGVQEIPTVALSLRDKEVSSEFI